MRLRLTYLITGVFLLFTFVQCKDSLTQTTEPESDPNDNLKTELAKPSLITPETNSEQSTSTTLEWEEIEEVELFHVQLSMDTSFDSTLADSVVESTSFTVNDLPSDTTFYWQVRSVAGDDEGPWSAAWNFTTAPKSSDPEPVSTELKAPGDGTEIRPDDIELQWQKIDDASGYNLQLAEDQKFESVVVDKEVEKTSYQTSDLDNSENYYWKVKPVIAEKTTEWSDVYEFITNSEAETTPRATLESPEDEAGDLSTTLNLEWEEISGIDSYQVQLATSDDFSSPEVDETVNSTSHEVSDLDNDQTYYWRVQADGDENSANWSETYEFTTEADADSTPKAMLVSPEDEASDLSTTLNLEWEEISGIDSYQVQLAMSDDFSSPVMDKTVSNTSYEASDLDYNQTYYWRVQASGDGDAENWSETFTFTTETEPVPPVTLISPEDEAGDLSTTLNLEWEKISGIDSYRVQLARSEDFSSPEADETVDNTSHEVSNLDYDQTYYWRVQADGDGDTENWSSVRSFSTESEPVDDGGDYPNSVEGDRQALMDLYEATGGDSWDNNGGWGNGDPSGSWHGVEVNADGRVVRLDLQDNGLTGTLPESIGNLAKLKYLNIKQNALSGDLPSSLGNLGSVKWLLLSGVAEDPPTNPQHTVHQGKSDKSGNTFTGTIPSALGNLDNMEYLELSGSEVTGEIPPEIFNAQALKFVAFSWNKYLTGGIPSTIGNADNLIWFYARSSNLDGTIPDEISQATTLRTIHLGNNDEWGGEGMRGELPDLRPLTDLRNFNLDQNNFSGPWPDYWNNGNFDNLIMLRASWNEFHTDQLHEFDNLTQLLTFVLTGSDIQGTLPQSVTQLNNMIIFSLGWTPVAGELPESGWDFHQLRQIRLNNTNMTGNIPCTFWEGVDNPDLKMVHLQNSAFDSNCDSSMNDVEGHDNLEIKIGGNNF